MSDLKPEHKIFVLNYIVDWNASRAYKVAYPSASDETARSNSSKLLTNANIQAYVEDIQKDLEKVAGLSRLKILQEHQKLAFSSIAHLHLTWITRKEFDQLTDDQKACIAEISTQTRFEKDYSTDPDGTVMQIDYVKIKLYDKQKSLDSISKMLGYNEPEKIEHSIGEKQTMIIGGMKVEF